MAYWKDTYEFEDSIEHEYKYAGNYGAKGEKRAEKKKPTKEQIARQNQTNRVIRMRRLIKANFKEKDYWCCLQYPKGFRLPLKEVKKDVKEFLRLLRKEYRARNKELKHIKRLEIGKYGGIHAHIIVPRIWTAQTDIILDECWQKAISKRKIRTEGLLDYKTIYEYGGYQALAEYICKIPKEESKEYQQLCLFPVEEQKQLLSVSTSRNLIRPEPKRKKYSHWTMRRILENGPKPRDGFFIDKDSIICGINPYTGMSYYKYTEIRIRGETA